MLSGGQIGSKQPSEQSQEKERNQPFMAMQSRAKCRVKMSVKQLENSRTHIEAAEGVERLLVI